MQLIIRGQATHVLSCDAAQKIGDLKSEIAAFEQLQAEDIVLFASGKPVLDDDLASAFENEGLELSVPLLGGKVHGSLARAGKLLFIGSLKQPFIELR